MDIFSGILLGFEVAATWNNIFYCLMGCLLGTMIGVLPGLGPAATVAMLLPFTFSLDTTGSLIMLAGIYYGAQYGGSTTAIFLNIPGEASSVVTAIDGHKMAKAGRGGVAITIAALGSFIAGCSATVLMAVFAPLLTIIALSFGAPQYFALMILGLVVAVALAHGSVLKSLAMTLLGLLIGLVGVDVNSGIPRFTGGEPSLYEGVNIVAISMGLFGVAEVAWSLFNTSVSKANAKLTSLIPTRDDLQRSRGPILRGTAVGSLLGLLPGGGAMLSSFVSYAMERRMSRTPERFGNGAVEGVAGPEAANNAGAQTSFIPMLTLGIPSNGIMALMAGAMIMKGIQPGPSVMVEQPDLFWGLIASMWIGNLILVILNVPLAGIWIRMISVPYKYLAPAILAFCAIGAYTVNSNIHDVYILFAFGILGFVLRYLGFEVAPLVLGVILGPLLEENFRRSMLLSRGEFSIFWESGITLTLLGISAITLLLMALPTLRRRREAVFTESD